MAKKIFLFPGQGSQAVGMGKSLVENFALAKQTFEERVAEEYTVDEFPHYFADFFDGDADDAYISGEEDGKIKLARQLLKYLEENV